MPLACRTSLAFQESTERQLFTNLEVKLYGCKTLTHTVLDVGVYQCNLSGLKASSTSVKILSLSM